MHVFIFVYGWVVPYAVDSAMNSIPHVNISTRLDSDQDQSHTPIHVANFPTKGFFHSNFYADTVDWYDFWTTFER